MAAIKPARYLIVYPAMMRRIEREWSERIAEARAASLMRIGTAPEVSQVDVPPDVHALSTLSRIDYEDAFLAETLHAHDRSAEGWARAILEDAPIKTRSTLVSGWTSLGLQLGSLRSDAFVLGWKVQRSTPEFLLLGASSRVGMPAELVVRRGRARGLAGDPHQAGQPGRTRGVGDRWARSTARSCRGSSSGPCGPLRARPGVHKRSRPDRVPTLSTLERRRGR